MKLSVHQQSFSKAISIVARAVSSRTTMPVLSNILLSAHGDQLRLAATNREIGITCWIAATVEDEGAITVPARLLGEFVNGLPPERIDMELADRTQTLRMKCAKFNANIKGVDAYEFPLLPTFAELPEDAQRIAVPVSLLRQGIDQTVFAASDDQNRPTLTGIEVTFGEQLTLAATDGYRLSVRTLPLTQPVAEAKVIVPARSLGELARISDDANDELVQVAITPKRNQIMFAVTGDPNAKAPFQRVEMVSELIDARFPDYRATMPKNCNTRTVVDTAALLKATKVALLFARDNANIVRLNIASDIDGNGRISLAAHSAEMGDNVSELDATVEGDAIEISFNAKYMIDALSQVPQQRVLLETTQSTRPGLWRPVGDDGYMHVTMPMHREAKG